ncbi:MAG TPA: hypothetical protein VFA10_18285 [Ktedonobacteraceae bacterium]|nr:hypothetical protein [Ktedonobacteraceae bacterium]
MAVQEQWEIVAQLFERVKRYLGEADCTVIADRGLSCLRLIQLRQAQGWQQACGIVGQTGKHCYGTIRLVARSTNTRPN